MQADSIPSQEQARRLEVERDPLRWILDVLSSLEDDPDDPPPTIVACEEVRGCGVSYGGRFSLERLDAICVDASGRRWSLSLAVGFDSGSYWEQPESEIVGTWELMQQGADMDHIEGYEGEVLVEAEKPVAQQGGDVLTMFAAARDALRSERGRLMAEKSRIEGQIAAIDAALAPAQVLPEVTKGKFASATEPQKPHGIAGRGATAAIRAMFMAAPDRRVDFSQIATAVGSRSRAGALCQNLLRSGQIKKIRTGKFVATDKLAEFAVAD